MGYGYATPQPACRCHDFSAMRFSVKSASRRLNRALTCSNRRSKLTVKHGDFCCRVATTYPQRTRGAWQRRSGGRQAWQCLSIPYARSLPITECMVHGYIRRSSHAPVQPRLQGEGQCHTRLQTQPLEQITILCSRLSFLRKQESSPRAPRLWRPDHVRHDESGTA